MSSSVRTGLDHMSKWNWRDLVSGRECCVHVCLCVRIEITLAVASPVLARCHHMHHSIESSWQSHESGFIIPILQIGKWSLGKVKWLALDRITREWHSTEDGFFWLLNLWRLQLTLCRSLRVLTCKVELAGKRDREGNIRTLSFLSLSLKLVVWMTVESKKSCVRESSYAKVKRNVVSASLWSQSCTDSSDLYQDLPLAPRGADICLALGSTF